jgi:hypothetical protein
MTNAGGWLLEPRASFSDRPTRGARGLIRRWPGLMFDPAVLTPQAPTYKEVGSPSAVHFVAFHASPPDITQDPRVTVTASLPTY